MLGERQRRRDQRARRHVRDGRGSASYPRSTRSMRSMTGCSATPGPRRTCGTVGGSTTHDCGFQAVPHIGFSDRHRSPSTTSHLGTEHQTNRCRSRPCKSARAIVLAVPAGQPPTHEHGSSRRRSGTPPPDGGRRRPRLAPISPGVLAVQRHTPSVPKVLVHVHQCLRRVGSNVDADAATSRSPT